jgi:hypothetical protein
MHGLSVGIYRGYKHPPPSPGVSTVLYCTTPPAPHVSHTMTSSDEPLAGHKHRVQVQMVIQPRRPGVRPA